MAKVYFVGAGPGDPDLITLKGRRLLDRAGLVIYAGSLVNPALLSGISAETMDSAGMDLDATTEAIRAAMEKDINVVRLHTGDLSFYSAITEQIHRLKGLDIKYEIVPGVSSLAAGSAAIGTELTIPEVSQSVIVTRQAGRTPVPEAEAIKLMASHKCTMAIFLSVGMMGNVTEELRTGGYHEATPVIVIEKASWPDERVVKGTLADIAGKVAEAGITKTALIFVGDALAAADKPTGAESKLYDKDFRHGYRK